MAYLRFVVSQLNSESGVEDGLFGAAYALRDRGVLSADLRSKLEDHIS
jgi:hypothetical protein